MEEKEAKKSLEETRALTKGTMPIIIVVIMSKNMI